MTAVVVAHHASRDQTHFGLPVWVKTKKNLAAAVAWHSIFVPQSLRRRFQGCSLLLRRVWLRHWIPTLDGLRRPCQNYATCDSWRHSPAFDDDYSTHPERRTWTQSSMTAVGHWEEVARQYYWPTPIWLACLAPVAFAFVVVVVGPFVPTTVW